MSEAQVYLSVNQAADYLAVRPCTIRKWLLERRLAYVKVGGRAVRISTAALKAMITDRPAVDGTR